MTSEVETLYQRIAQSIANAIPELWETAWVTVEFEPGVISEAGGYTSLRDKTQHTFSTPNDIGDLFTRLRQLVKRDDRNIWSRARFVLEADGKFRIDFDYRITGCG